jgi:hypothetical protein
VKSSSGIVCGFIAAARRDAKSPVLPSRLDEENFSVRKNRSTSVLLSVD